MRTRSRTLPSTGLVALGLTILLQQIITTRQVFGSQADTKLLSKWQPLAMDEALLVRSDISGQPAINDYPKRDESLVRVSDDAEPSRRTPVPIEETPLFSGRSYHTQTFDPMDDFMTTDDEAQVNKLAHGDYISLPEVPTSKLTRLITNQGKDAPTFTMDQIQEPILAASNRRDKKGDAILASYNLMIPIFVPAIRSKAFLTTIRPETIKFVKETVTELVPMTKTVPQVKEVIKAERVPQKLLTDYVTTRSRTVPPRITDAVLPGERIVTSTMTLID